MEQINIDELFAGTEFDDNDQTAVKEKPEPVDESKPDWVESLLHDF